jgi:hypothetical protein
MAFDPFIPAKRADVPSYVNAAYYQAASDQDEYDQRRQRKSDQLDSAVAGYKGISNIYGQDKDPITDLLRAGKDKWKNRAGAPPQKTNVPDMSAMEPTSTPRPQNGAIPQVLRDGGVRPQVPTAGGKYTPVVPQSTGMPPTAPPQASAAPNPAANPAAKMGAGNAVSGALSAASGVQGVMNAQTKGGKIKAGVGGVGNTGLATAGPALAAAGPVGWAGLAGLAAMSLYGMFG